MSKNDPPAMPMKRSQKPVTRDDRELIERAMYGTERLQTIGPGRQGKPDPITPEVLARWEELAAPPSTAECYWCGSMARGVASRDEHGIMQRQSCGEHGNGFRLFMVDVPSEEARALLSGVRSRDARIAEQDEEIATLRQQRREKEGQNESH